jgi:flavin reductase (DIM6/NTAB) family NADH-FMN oxidoreductase RutF
MKPSPKKPFLKKDLPVSQIRRFLEPGPIVLVSSAWRGQTNIMTLGWHTVMEFEPSRIGCYIWDQNHSFGLIKASKQCVINIPTYDLISQAIGIGNCSGASVDKFAEFALTPLPAQRIDAPLIKECYANFECRLVEFLARYSFFVFEVLRAHVATAPKYPKTFHYRGDGVFMISGRNVSFRARMKAQNL